jgi:hypothetical protein
MPSSESDHQRKGGFVDIRARVRTISQPRLSCKLLRNRGASRPLLRMQPIRINPIYQASAERLFDAWTKPDQMRLWLFKSPTNKIVRIDQILTVGGRYSILEKADGREIDHYGEYTAIDPPHRLAFWLEVPTHFEGKTDIVVSFIRNPKAAR